MEADSSPSDGFDFPVGDPNGNAQSGWTHENNFGAEESSGIHSGEDWNHAEGDNQSAWDVCAIAIGRVVVAQERGGDCGNVVVIEHTFYENYEKMRILSVYAHLSQIKVGNGEHVRRRQVIGSIGAHGYNRQHADLHLELRWDETLEPCYRPSADNKDRYWLKAHYSSPTEFIKKHRNLLVPQQEQLLILVHQESYKMRMYRTAQMQGEYEVSFGQGRGQKLVQGDNKTPKGMYFVTQKHRGYFGGPYGRYYGKHWIVINYPNKYDALRGLAEGIISSQQAANITARWEKRGATAQDTALGGGIGFHGWISEWDNAGPRHLSWGCVVMHIYDISRLYEQIPEGTMVVIF